MFWYKCVYHKQHNVGVEVGRILIIMLLGMEINQEDMGAASVV